MPSTTDATCSCGVSHAKVPDANWPMHPVGALAVNRRLDSEARHRPRAPNIYSRLGPRFGRPRQLDTGHAPVVSAGKMVAYPLSSCEFLTSPALQSVLFRDEAARGLPVANLYSNSGPLMAAMVPMSPGVQV